jgi:hypothetical protein
LGAKNHETERGGSISGGLCKTAVIGDGGRSWRGVDEAVVVVGLRIRQREVEEGGWGPKTTKPSTVARFRVRRAKWW